MHSKRASCFSLKQDALRYMFSFKFVAYGIKGKCLSLSALKFYFNKLFLSLSIFCDFEIITKHHLLSQHAILYGHKKEFHLSQCLLLPVYSPLDNES